MKNQDLYRKLDVFEIDSATAALPFSVRLAKENDWTVEFAHRCIKEYKRFLYLAACSDRPVSPSHVIDQVWHMHLTYTVSYWEQLCQNLLTKPLHHIPAQGGCNEQQQFAALYEHTLVQYYQEFGESPPQDIWPPRNSEAIVKDFFVRVNRAHFWIVPKFSKRLMLLPVICCALAACSLLGDDQDFWFYIKIAVLIFVVYKILKWLSGSSGGRGGSGGGSSCGSGCSSCGGGGD